MAYFAGEQNEKCLEILKLLPDYLDVHRQANEWEPLNTIQSEKCRFIKDSGNLAIGGMNYHPDNRIEPLRHSLIEFRYA